MQILLENSSVLLWFWFYHMVYAKFCWFRGEWKIIGMKEHDYSVLIRFWSVSNHIQFQLNSAWTKIQNTCCLMNEHVEVAICRDTKYKTVLCPFPNATMFYVFKNAFRLQDAVKFAREFVCRIHNLLKTNENLEYKGNAVCNPIHLR